MVSGAQLLGKLPDMHEKGWLFEAGVGCFVIINIDLGAATAAALVPTGLYQDTSWGHAQRLQDQQPSSFSRLTPFTSGWDPALRVS